MTDLDTIISMVTAITTPSPSEKKKIDALAARILAKTEEEAGRYTEVHDAILGGSFAKGTWLPSDVDIDVFIRISPQVDVETFERIGLSIGSRVASGHPKGKKYAQHPYTEATIDGVRVNLVPCYDVEPPNWKSAADRSPYHLRLVEGLRDDQKLQIRLLKRFMKGVGVYGAEIESQGFSGYVAEVLVMKYADFEGVLRILLRIQTTEPGTILLFSPTPLTRTGSSQSDFPGEARQDDTGIKSLPQTSRVELLLWATSEGADLSRTERGLYRILTRQLSEDTLWGTDEHSDT